MVELEFHKFFTELSLMSPTEMRRCLKALILMLFITYIVIGDVREAKRLLSLIVIKVCSINNVLSLSFD